MRRLLSVVFLFVLTYELCGVGPKASAASPLVQRKREISVGIQSSRRSTRLVKDDLESFFDGFIPIQLQRDDIAGAVVLVVKDGKVLFAKGYGYADLKTHKPVAADSTLFRVGSISKTFTWTAVMQLVEQGKIDLDRDVNDYLDFKIPTTFGRPITMKDVMTHTAGFEETRKDLIVLEASDMQSLRDYVASHLPKRIFPPGTIPAYSNYGAALAGYIVQQVSGKSFDDYVEQSILDPLGMKRSTFRQPLPGNLQPLLSEGYSRSSLSPKEFELFQPAPAGSLSATADDISRFMIAHLHGGEYQGVRILKPETAQLMHSRAFGLLPSMNGMAYGFYEESRNGHRIIGHDGDTQWFYSGMHLVPDEDLGFFVGYNSEGKGGYSGRSALWQSFLDRYFPYTPPTTETTGSAIRDAHFVAGTYWFSRRSEGNFASLTAGLSENNLTVNSDGTISLGSEKDFAGNPKHFKEIGPLLFRDVNGQSQLGFTKDYSGRPIVVIDFPVFVLQLVPGLKHWAVSKAVVTYAMAVFLLTVLYWPLSALMRAHYRYRPESTLQYMRLRSLMRSVCIANLVFIGTLAAWRNSVSGNIALNSSHFDRGVNLFQLVGLLSLIGAPISIYYLACSWKSTLWVWAKVWNTLLMLACIGYAWFLLNWHLLNFHLN